MKREKDIKSLNDLFESNSVKQAERKNRSLRKRNDMWTEMAINNARKRYYRKFDKDRSKIVQDLKEIEQRVPLPGCGLANMQRRRQQRRHDVALHLANCYLMKQEANKRMWFNMQINNELFERPVRTPDHFNFIAECLPSAYSDVRQTHGPTYIVEDRYNIYHLGFHDPPEAILKRKMTYGEKAGLYPEIKPVNFNYWKPKEEDLTYLSEAKWELQNTQNCSFGPAGSTFRPSCQFVALPDLGYVQLRDQTLQRLTPADLPAMTLTRLRRLHFKKFGSL